MSTSGATPPADGAAADAVTDPVAVLVTALGGYLDDVEQDCRECARLEAVATVVATGADLSLSWRVPRTRALTTRLRRSVGDLPGWRDSPFWASDRTRLEALDRQAWAGVATPRREDIVCRGISWHGRPVLIRATPAAEQVTVGLLLPGVYREWPELPLRRVADAARCYAAIVPHDLARPSPRSSPLAAGAETVGRYLTRAMPPDLYASQCFALHQEQN